MLYIYVSVALAIITGTCATLTYPSPAAMFLTYCADVVKYSYFLPAGKTPAQLNAEAEALVYQASFVWPSTCQASIKKLVCASVYLNCTGYDMNDSTNWNVGVYNSSFPVPYKIPCKSTCLNVRMQCNDMPAQQTPPLPKADEHRLLVLQVDFLAETKLSTTLCSNRGARSKGRGASVSP